MNKKSGFIDLHTHGIGQYSTKTGNPVHILKMAELQAKAGTTAILPTIYSGTIQHMRGNMEAVREAMQTQKRERAEVHKTSELPGSQTSALRSTATILGVHLEGPFLNPAQCGAQNKGSFTKPSIAALKKLIDGYEDIVKIITIAPELPGALKVIEKCVSYGIKVNMGHSDATYKQALEGKKAGAVGISHIFNAMRPFHQREPGLAGMGMIDEDIYIEIIADNVHLSRITVELIFKIKRRDRIILVSDSVQGAQKRKRPLFLKSGILAGSAITLADAVKNLKDTGIPEKTAVKIARENPQRYLK
jgi:N-acetylglucosamine-6-phosphate deacetylase